MFESDESEGQVDQSEECFFAFVVSSRNAAKLFEFVDVAFNLISFTVTVGHEWPRFGAIAAIRDIGEQIAIDACPTQFVGVESLVAVDFVEVLNAFDGLVHQWHKKERIVGLSRHHIDGNGGVGIGRRQHDFAGQSAAAATNSGRCLASFFFDAPAAC